MHLHFFPSFFSEGLTRTSTFRCRSKGLLAEGRELRAKGFSAIFGSQSSKPSQPSQPSQPYFPFMSFQYEMYIIPAFPRYADYKIPISFPYPIWES